MSNEYDPRESTITCSKCSKTKKQGSFYPSKDERHTQICISCILEKRNSQDKRPYRENKDCDWGNNSNGIFC